MLQNPLFSAILETQRRGRTILHAGQTSVTLIIDTKIGHGRSPIRGASWVVQLPNGFSRQRSLGRRPDLRLLLAVIRHKRQRPGKTKPHALGIAVTQIAFEDPTALGIETDGPEGAYRHAHAATDTAVVVDHDPLQDRIPVNGFPGADFQARRRLTMSAADRQMGALGPVFQEANPSPFGIDHAFLGQGTSDLAQSAAGTLVRIDDEGSGCPRRIFL
jgi:hypothetical protein